jgi:hypothetical protein
LAVKVIDEYGIDDDYGTRERLLPGYSDCHFRGCRSCVCKVSAEEGGGEAKLYQLLVAVVNTKVMFHVASTTIRTVCVCCCWEMLWFLSWRESWLTLLALK